MSRAAAPAIQRAPVLATAVRGARTHNLKSVDLELRPGELVAFTGPSGAGESSLAIDTRHAAGQRRFVESFLKLPPFGGHPRRRENARGVIHGEDEGKAEATVIFA